MNRLPLYFFPLLLALCLAACGRSAEGPKELTTLTGLYYAAEPVPLPSPLGIPELADICGDTLYVSGDNNGSPALYALNLTDDVWRDMGFEGPGSRIEGLAASDSALFVLSMDTETCEASMTVYGAGGQDNNSFPFEGPPNYTPSTLTAVNDVFILCVPGDSAYIYSSDGRQLARARPNGVLQSVSVIDGEPVMWATGQDGQLSLYSIDTVSGELTGIWTGGEAFSMLPTISCQSLGGGLTADREAVYTYDESSQPEPLLYWLDCGLSAPERLVRAGSGDMYAVSGGELLRLSVKEGPIKTELLIAGVGNAGELAGAVSSFNRSSGRYVARLKTYAVEQADVLLTEITAGNGPDVLFFSGDSPLSGLSADGGVFADLLPYIDSDQDIRLSDMLSSVLSGAAPDGHMYLLYPFVDLDAFIADISTAAGLSGGTLDSLAALDGRCDVYNTLFDFYSKEDFLDYACALAQAAFTDAASCSFDDPDFSRLLELVNGTAYYEYPLTQGALISRCKSPGYDAAAMTSGDELVGFPIGGKQLFLLTAPNSYGILASSMNKDAAWQLLRRLLLPDIQGGSAHIPVMEENIKSSLAAAASESYEYLGGGMDRTAWDALVGANIDKIKSAAEKGVLTVPSPLDDIIKDEAQRYFSGQKSLNDAVSSIQSRAGVYLAERYG